MAVVNTRRVLLVALLALAFSLAAHLAMGAERAEAYSQNYCGFIAPGIGNQCYTSGLHSFRSNTAQYPGPFQHNVQVCEYMWNASAGQVRGGPNWMLHCGANFSSIDWGPTNQPSYNARVWNNSCCNHTVSGFAYAD